MDPYKVLGVSANNIKHESDLKPARQRAKLLFKRHNAEGKKFDAKKVLEAFEMIKKNLKGTLGSGQYKLLGRSRKERELDKHFNHQTKEIKNDKGLKRALKDAALGEKRMRLRGEKERVARPRRRTAKHNEKKKEKMKKHVDSLQGLQKLAGFLSSKGKFAKAVPLLNRWVREYMNQDNRGHIFEVLHAVAKEEYVTDDADSRQQVIQVFEYVMGYFSAFFEENDEQKTLALAWRMACVLSCHCHTDDAFMLSRTITSLNEALTLLEGSRALLEEEPKGSPGASPGPEEAGNFSPQGSPSPFADSDGGEAGEGEMMEFYPDSSDEDEAATKEEVKTETKEEIKDEKDIKEEVKTEIKVERPAKGAIEISLDSDDDGKVGVIDSEESVHDIDSMEEDEVYESLSSGASSEVEEVDSTFRVPTVASSYRMLSEHFVHRCLGTLFMNRGPMWARPKIDAFFQDVYYRRSIFTPGQQTQVEAWQARIKVLQKGGERIVGEANNPMEAHRPVIDSREMNTIIDSDSNAWAAKQTFDSRGTAGGIR